MAIPAVRIIAPTVERNFGRFGDAAPVPPLTDIQTRSYDRFLQLDAAYDKRTNSGLEGVMQEIFPIESYDKKISLEYVKYELGKPRYDADECRQLRLTYGRPFRVWLRLRKADGNAVEEEVYLGDMPIMIGGGEFIINGAERVVVSQLHRSAGVDFVVERERGQGLHSPAGHPGGGAAGSRSRHHEGHPRASAFDQRASSSHRTLRRAMDPQYSSTASIIRSSTRSDGALADPKARSGCRRPEPVPAYGRRRGRDRPRAGEVYVDSGKPVHPDGRRQGEWCHQLTRGLALGPPKDPIILQSMAEDGTDSHEAALLKIYQRLRPGNPAQLEKAKDLFKEKFLDPNRYRLGRVGRFRINRKFDQTVPETEMTLRAVDFVNAVKYLLDLRAGKGGVDDIDHLGNRRLRTIDELAADELRKGFLKLRRTVQERMAIKDAEEMTPRTLINPKSVSAAIEYFFGRSELSQVVDQTNPLAQLTHERRLSALGPGGLNRKRAGFEVRDVHNSHYGRICPIETPEGTNIGLISSLAIFSEIDEYGFLTTPYRKVAGKHLSPDVVKLRADEESQLKLARPTWRRTGTRSARTDQRPGGRRADGDRGQEVEYIDVSPKQMVGVSAGLIPFLEHDDANRRPDGLEHAAAGGPAAGHRAADRRHRARKEVARHSGMLVRPRKTGSSSTSTASGSRSRRRTRSSASTCCASTTG
jgi:DNA-directed RNA polymerase subunit beta